MKIFFLAITFLAMTFSIHAQQQDDSSAEITTESSTENLSARLTKINFIGLKKTSPSYLQSRVQKYTGNPLSETDLHELETDLQLEGIFNEIKIETEETGTNEIQVNVTVKEKITFVPVPFAIYSNSSLLAGAIILDTNAFGKKDMFILGGFAGKNAKTGMASFASPPKDNWIPGFSIFTLGSIFTPEFSDTDDKTVLKYEDSYYQIKLQLTEKLPHDFFLVTGLDFTDHRITEHEDFRLLTPEAVKIGLFSLSLEYSNSDWNGIFMSTNTATISTDFGLTDSKDSDLKHPYGFSFAIGEEHPVFTDRIRFYQKYSGYYGKNIHTAALKSVDSASVSILSSHFSSSKLAGGRAGLEAALKKFNWGMFSVYGDWQCLFVEDFAPAEKKADREFMHGFSAGTKIYLAKIAFPAFAMGLSYNINKHYYRFSAALGATF